MRDLAAIAAWGAVSAAACSAPRSPPDASALREPATVLAITASQAVGPAAAPPPAPAPIASHDRPRVQGVIACGDTTCQAGTEMCCNAGLTKCYTREAHAADLASVGIQPTPQLCRVPPSDIDRAEARWCDDSGDCPEGKVCCHDGQAAVCGDMPCDAICSGDDGGCPNGHACRDVTPGYFGRCEPTTAGTDCRRHADCGAAGRRCCIGYTGRSYCTFEACRITEDYTEACETVSQCPTIIYVTERNPSSCDPELGRCEYDMSP